jgi:general secretion pathway protein F
MENQQKLKNKISAALAYPILMALFGTAVLFFLLAHIVPSITTIFVDMNQVLPAPTRFLIATSDFIKSYGWLLLLLVAVLVGFYTIIKKTVRGRYAVDRLKLRLPLFGPLLTRFAVARLTRTLGSLLENGVPLLSALNIVKNITGNVLITEAIEVAAEDVSEGQPLAASLDKSRLFPGLSIQMIQVGEQSGALENMLYKVAAVFENDVEASILRLTSMLEPVMIMVMGVVVGFIVLSICLPIFEMNQLIR